MGWTHHVHDASMLDSLGCAEWKVVVSSISADGKETNIADGIQVSYLELHMPNLAYILL